MTDELLRNLPSVRAVLEAPILIQLTASFNRQSLVGEVRAVIQETRLAIQAGLEPDVRIDTLARLIARRMRTKARALRPVINASGILLNTGLGRAPLAPEAIEAVTRVSAGYCSLEIDLELGGRGSRTSYVEDLLQELTGAEAASVVNNNAAATVLVLRALAAGREVILSRGQLIEIGGSFRLPEIFEVSGAILREVGTTNKTHLADYAGAISPMTGALLHVHPSNYCVVGFAQQVPLIDIVHLAHQHGLPAIADIGSGVLTSGLPPHTESEPSAEEAVRSGADIVLFSGDKLLGGPQCGILLGKKIAIAHLESNPLMRALRVDKMTIAALEATLLVIADRTRSCDRIPLWGFMTSSIDHIRRRAENLALRLRRLHGFNADVVDSSAHTGGGSLPVESISSAAVRIAPPIPFPWCTASSLNQALRTGDPAVVGRLHKGCLFLDLRAVPARHDSWLTDAVRRSLHTLL
jgi:L-seryl-tRNA(Ser) seleniumtransferase